MSLIQPGDDVYPVGALDLEEPPPLFVLGALVEAPGVAVVGSRRCTGYGLRLAESFGAALSAAGWTTVSGMARGIDAAAHRGCLAGGGHAVAVLGTGVDVCYPRENSELREGILAAGGALVSEYPDGTPPDRWRFPARNRIMAAISAAVVVVEAAVTGGALITARVAAEIGRPVFAVPGDVDRPASEGCNRLIRDGAAPVLGARDLIQELQIILGPPAPNAKTGPGVIPPEGAVLGDLPDLWDLPVTQTLALLGRLEAEGTVRRSGDQVFPV